MEDFGSAMIAIWVAIASVTAVCLIAVLTVTSIFLPIPLIVAAPAAFIGGAAYATVRFMLQ